MRFFHLNFLNARKIHNEHAIFRQFSDVKTWEGSQQRIVLSDGYRWIPAHQN